MSEPFWFLKSDPAALPKPDIRKSLGINDDYLRPHGAEMEASRALDAYLAQSMRMEDFPWYKAMKIGVYIYTFLTLCILIHRTDFLNLGICILSLYMINNVEKLRKWMFRVLFFAIAMSWVYDLAWLFLHTSSFWTHKTGYDGGLEQGVRRFVVVITFLSFIFRLFIVVIYWKVSIDFEKIQRDHQVQ